MRSEVRFKEWSRFVLALALLGLSPLSVSASSDANPGVLPNTALPQGTSYGDWGAEWWQWALSAPLDVNPVVDLTGEHCGVNQSGQVWFLAGSFGDPVVTRECAVPQGKMLFFPIINVVVWGDDVCPDVESCKAFATEIVDFVDLVEVEIDGEPISDPRQYRAQSEAFALEVVDGLQDAGFEPGTYDPAVAEGYYLLLAPLQQGQHVINFRGGVSAFGLEIDVTYYLTVGP